MAGKLMGTILIIAFLTYMILFAVFFFMHQTIVMDVNKINYSVVEAAATSGKFSKDMFDYLNNSLAKYGKYKIKIKWERLVKDGIYDTYFEDIDFNNKNQVKIDANTKTGEVVNKTMKIGDRFTIYVEDTEPTLFGRLLNATFLGYSRDRTINNQIKSIKTAIIANNARELVKGYDVIADINTRYKSEFTTSGVAIFVSTKLNPTGKYYGKSGHRDESGTIDVAVDNLEYGNVEEPDEAGNTGLNYIFDNGDFLKTEEYYQGYDPDGNGIDDTIRLINYIQQ